MEKWNGKSGHGAEFVRHAEMRLVSTGDRSGLSVLVGDGDGLVPGSCGEIILIL